MSDFLPPGERCFLCDSDEASVRTQRLKPANFSEIHAIRLNPCLGGFALIRDAPPQRTSAVGAEPMAVVTGVLEVELQAAM